MPYQPTGRPVGRPRNDGTPVKGPAKPPQAKGALKPVAPKPPAVKPEAPEPEVRAAPPVRPEPGLSRPGPYAICRECWPDGWPKGATGLGCGHGIWSRPWMG